MPFTVTIKYFGSKNTWVQKFSDALSMYSYMDAIRPFICYSKVEDDVNHFCQEKRYERPKETK